MNAALLFWLCASEVLSEEAVKVTFVNKASQDLHVYWINHEGVAELKDVIRPNSTSLHSTFSGHAFQIHPAEATHEPSILKMASGGEIQCYEEAGFRCLPQWQPAAAETRYTGPRWDGIVAEVLGDCFDSLKDHPGDAAHFCNHDPTRWHRSQCKFDFTPEEFQREQQQHIDEGREIILSQPPQFVNFTQSGYEARDLEQVLGTDLLGEVRNFWLGNRLRGSVPENNAKLDLALSSCESNSWLLPLPDEMKLRVFNAVQPHLAGWIGMSGDDLEPTAMYGVRMYRNGSVLNLHVDKPHTHAVSAILEIGHLGFGHPDSEFEQQEPSWPLRILNHKGEEKLVPNRAGQAIFYESATCPHGRPSVLHSREFANVFVHFRPKGWPGDFMAH
ncbi:unnamed protein product [Effrenium voratum]|uniref:Fe2OG dioxygenase domain-containing protein n=1 Tax=Effrenium voratum TaxID=2562239 RepID=A0AA36MWJ0_9DINO|nr:unnamed protein product [Effrenium voratum]